MKSHSDAAQNEAVPATREATADTASSALNSPKSELVPPPAHQKIPDDVDAFDVTITAIVGPSEASVAQAPVTPANPPPAPLAPPPQVAENVALEKVETSTQKPETNHQDEVSFAPVITQEIEVHVGLSSVQDTADNSAPVDEANLASQITEAHEVTPAPSNVTPTPEPTPEPATTSEPTPLPTSSATSPHTTGHALPTLPQQAISFPLPDAKIFSTNSDAEERSSAMLASSSTSADSSATAHTPPLAPASPPSAPPRSKKARLAFAVMATALSLMVASQLLDPNWSPRQILPTTTQAPELSEREPTVFEWICLRQPVDAQGIDQRSQQFVSFQTADSTAWQDVEWKMLAHDANVTTSDATNDDNTTETLKLATTEQAEFKTQAGDRVQIGLADCEVITYGSRAKVRSQQLVQLPQINSPAAQARFFASLLNPATVTAKNDSQTSNSGNQDPQANSSDTTGTTNEDADLAHPLALSLPFVGIAQKAHDASRVIEDQLILTEHDLDLRYEPSFGTEAGEQPAPSLSLTRYRFEWSQTPEFFEGEARRIEPTSDGRFAPPSLPIGDSFVRVVDLLSQATGPVTHLRVLDLPVRYESSQDSELEGRPARKLRWKSHPLAAGYELKVFAKRGSGINSASSADENERVLHVDETERVIAPLQGTSFFWTVQAIDEQGLPITTVTTPRLENVSARFIIGDDGNRGHRPQDVDPRGLKISKAQSAAQDEIAAQQVEPLTPLDGEVIVAGTRDTEYGQLTWGQPQHESRSPAAQDSSATKNRRSNSQFELQLATDADFVNVLFTKKVTRSAFKLKGDLPEGSLFYRVRQLPKGQWSSVRKFQLVYE